MHRFNAEPRAPATHPRRGVVLLDVVLALAILALGALVLMPRPTAGVSASTLQAEAARAAAEFRRARAQALRSRGPVDVHVDPARRVIRYDGSEPLVLREGVRLSWITSSQCPLRDGGRALRYLADGRSCGGVMDLTSDRAAIQLRIDWLTGRVEMSTP